jgi:lipid-binding SYLF domain-containing protein
MAPLDASAAKTVKHFYALNPANWKLLEKAAGVLIFPRVTKGGAGIAGKFGEGVLQLKDETVNYYSVGSASIGLTLGVGQHSEIIMFRARRQHARARGDHRGVATPL